MGDFFFDLTSSTLTKSLDASAMRHKVIANNLANVDTPGFIRSDLSFESALKEALSNPSKERARNLVQSIEPAEVADTDTPVGPNGNNVSVDKEMADMTKNSLEYEALTRLLTMKGSMLLTAITEGKR